MKKVRFLFVIVFLLLGMNVNTNACSRVMYKGLNGIVMTARSMDWPGVLPTNLWIMPRGIDRDGFSGPKSLVWRSKYGSVITETFGGPTDGMNEKGLMANVLWCRETVFADAKTAKKTLSAGVWIQYLLDNFASVDEAVDAMSRRDFEVVEFILPGLGYALSIHVSISDSTGDNAIFEYQKGRLVVYHDKDYKVMTNEPTYDKQLAFVDYWKNIGGFVSLPGTYKPQDRFVRASFYTDVVPLTDDADKAVAIAMSVVREVSVPMGISTKDSPNMSTTIWRVIADHKRCRYYFEDAESLNSVVWIDMKRVDFSLVKGLRKLDRSQLCSGDVTDKMVQSKYMGIDE